MTSVPRRLAVTPGPTPAGPGRSGGPGGSGGPGEVLGWCHAGAPGRAFGGQVAAQALAAASRTVGADRRVISLHAQYVGPGDTRQAITYAVDAAHDGGTFATRTVRATQGPTLLALVTASFARPPRPPGPGAPVADSVAASAPGLTRPAPVVPTPEETPPTPFPDTPSGRSFAQVVEQRVVVAAESWDGTDVPVERRWMRFTESPGDDAAAHAAGLAYLSDIRLASVPAAHLRAAGRRLAVTTLDHTVWWHRPLRTDDWLLVDQRGVSLSAGLALATAEVYDVRGTLVASLAQQALVRVLD